MERRTIHRVLLGAILFSVVWGASGWAKPRFIRRLSATKTPAAEPIRWQPDLKTAQRVAQETGRPMLIVMGGDRCTYCKKLEAETLGDVSTATYINTSFVPVHLHWERDQRAAQILEVKALPTCVILSPEADLLGSVEGFVKPPEFTRLLHQSLDFQRKLQSEKESTAGFDR
ncbi:MAG TPA: thioredoxin family protein [Planctomycetaceae bacterium]|jgi:thioredoxin-related protein|nr:thioredoxin family protein [Planctomycetaceae bacterium]